MGAVRVCHRALLPFEHDAEIAITHSLLDEHISDAAGIPHLIGLLDDLRAPTSLCVTG